MFQSLFFNKVAGCRPPTLLKRDLGTFFSVNVAKCLRISFLQNNPGKLHLTARTCTRDRYRDNYIYVLCNVKLE